MDSKKRLGIVRKRANALIKSGLTESEAYIKAWAEFRERNKSKEQITEPPSNSSEQKLPDPVKNSVKTELEDKSPPTHRTEDGHWVRSRDEVIIDDWLYSHNIVHAYEIKLPEKSARYDFYIPSGKVYIEFCGLNEEKNLAAKATKSEIYRNNKLNLIELFDKDLSRLGDILPDQLRKHDVPVQ
jgi:hypothetical protein